MLTETVPIPDKGRTKLIAHRGLSGLECENTAAAFIAAGNRSYYGMETDIHRTADQSYICIHDGHTGRICDVDIPVEQSAFDELRALKLRDKDGATDRGELMLCTPYEYMKICKKYAKVCVAELKSNFTAGEISEIMRIFGDGGYLGKTCFIAFNMENLDLVKSVCAGQACQYLTSRWDDALPEMLAKRGMGLDISFGALTETRVKACHSLGVEVNCWTVDRPEDAERLIAWGVDMITTNILE
ncbi:MAG: hypothetical protein DBY36_05780 [Clostridiales bacterium]|nr:MAG: hypothetical protein DBY36_05780 [Clostridiales bacterium]